MSGNTRKPLKEKEPKRKSTTTQVQHKPSVTFLILPRYRLDHSLGAERITSFDPLHLLTSLHQGL